MILSVVSYKDGDLYQQILLLMAIIDLSQNELLHRKKISLGQQVKNVRDMHNQPTQ